MKIAQALVRSLSNLGNNLRTASAAPVQPLTAQEQKDWTVLVYLDGRDGLAYSSQQALRQLQENAGPSIHVAVQSTQEPNWRERLLPGMNSRPPQRYLVGSGEAKLVDELPNGSNLQDFLAWGMQKFPAKNVAVIVKTHGLGFVDAQELRQALEGAEAKTGQKPQVLAFDSCLMQQAEVAYELRQRADVMVASQSNVLAQAYPYGKLSNWLSQHSTRITPENLAQLVVQGHKLQAGDSIQTATKLSEMEKLARAVSSLSQTVREQKVPPSLVYTCMLQVPSIEGQDSRHIAFDYRDLSSFVDNLAQHPELHNQAVKEACQQVSEQVQAGLLGHHVSGPHATWKNAQGMTAYMPWTAPDRERAEEYQQLQWTQDSGWGQLVEYARQPEEQAEAPKAQAGRDHILAKTALYAYKKYVSPYLGKACTMTPSCSAYARQAIETHGLWEGIKFSTVRLCSCNGSFCGCNNVPGAEALAPEATKTTRISAQPQSAAWKNQLTGVLANGARMLGKVGGAMVGALLAAPAAAVVGTALGYQSGAGKLDGFNQNLFERYQPASQEAILELEAPLVLPAMRTREWLHQHAPAALAQPLSSLCGGLSGAALGLVGGLAVGAQWGQNFGGLLAGNATRDLLGELPPNPSVQASLESEHTLSR